MVLINSFYLLEGPLFGLGFLLLSRKTALCQSKHLTTDRIVKNGSLSTGVER